MFALFTQKHGNSKQVYSEILVTLMYNSCVPICASQSAS